MRRALLGLIFAAGVWLTLVASASATAPHHESESFDFSNSADCGTFQDDYQGHVTFMHTTFFDADGNPIVEHHKIMQTETDTDSVTGKSVQVKGSFTAMIDLRTGIERDVGQVFMGIGGKGANVIHDTGLVVFDANGDVLKVAGPHTVLEGGDEPFCQALS